MVNIYRTLYIPDVARAVGWIVLAMQARIAGGRRRLAEPMPIDAGARNPALCAAMFCWR
jgi:hypothetical protein